MPPIVYLPSLYLPRLERILQPVEISPFFVNYLNKYCRTSFASSFLSYLSIPLS
jgi:hypothetical protein